MKRTIILAMLGLIFSMMPARTFSQQREHYKHFPELPARPAKQLTARQDSSWNAFRAIHQSWEVRWSGKSGIPASLTGPPITLAQGTPQQIARQFLLQNRTLFRMKAGLAGLVLLKTEDRLRATHVIFQQTFAGIPVEGGIYAIHLTKDGRVYLANGEYFDDVIVPERRPDLSKADAIKVATDDLGPYLQLRNKPTGELVILPYGAEFRLVWKITVPAIEPLGEWLYLISAKDGSVLGGDNSADFAEATGSVYDRHPDAGPVVTRTLKNLLGNGYSLNGTYFQVFNEDNAEAYETDNTFIYDPTNTHFDEVMVYYHLERFRDDYLENLGYPYLNYPGSAVKVEATVHYKTNYNNAGAWPPNILKFGDGDGITRNDYAKEDDVIYLS